MTPQDAETIKGTLRPGTVQLLRELRSRREMTLSHQGPDGWWRFVHRRVRTTADFCRITRFPRCPATVRESLELKLCSLLAEARRYTDADALAARREPFPNYGALR